MNYFVKQSLKSVMFELIIALVIVVPIATLSIITICLSAAWYSVTLAICALVLVSVIMYVAGDSIKSSYDREHEKLTEIHKPDKPEYTTHQYHTEN